MHPAPCVCVRYDLASMTGEFLPNSLTLLILPSTLMTVCKCVLLELAVWCLLPVSCNRHYVQVSDAVLLVRPSIQSMQGTSQLRVY